MTAERVVEEWAAASAETAPPLPRPNVPASRGSRPGLWLVLVTVIAIGGIHTGAQIRRGWVPHDEGMIGQTAERVLEGEVPHRDFDDPYTGGLTYLNAAAFRVFGVNLLSPRIILVAFFIATIPVIYWCALRFASPTVAGAVTLLAVAWGLPNYVAAVPSWYNLCLSLLGVAALLRYIETDRARWLFVGGLGGGLSFLVKLVAIYFVAAAGLFFLYREQAVHSQQAPPTQSRVYSILLTAGLMLFVASLIAVIRRRIGMIELAYFVLPGAAFSALLVVREWHDARGTSSWARLAELGRMVIPFLTGFALPVAVFVVPYIRAGALGPWLTGVFILPSRRLSFAAMNSVQPIDPVGALISTEILAFATLAGRAIRWSHTILLGLLLTLLLAATSSQQLAYKLTWYSAAMLIPITVVAGTAVLSRFPPRLAGRDQQIALLIAVVALCSLVQFPFTVPIYFCYVAPLLILAIGSLIGAASAPSRPALAVVLVFYVLFAVLRATPGYIDVLGQIYMPDEQTHRLELPRSGGLLVYSEDAGLYPGLVNAIRSHASGQYMWAGPDCPEMYFLTGLRNPTRTLFDFFDDPEGRTQRIIGLLDEHQVNVIAIKANPAFSGPLEPQMLTELVARFPHLQTVGQFEVRWRE